MCYRNEINNFVEWCSSNFLFLNFNKTKEMIIDFRRGKPSHSKVSIDDKDIEVVEEYKYLGTILDSKLSWNSNTNHIYKNASSNYISYGN